MDSRHDTQGSIWFIRNRQFDSTKRALLLKRVPSLQPDSVKHCSAPQSVENWRIGSRPKGLLHLELPNKSFHNLSSPETRARHLTSFLGNVKKKMSGVTFILVHSFQVFIVDPGLGSFLCMKGWEAWLTLVRLLVALLLDPHWSVFLKEIWLFTSLHNSSFGGGQYGKNVDLLFNY